MTMPIPAEPKPVDTDNPAPTEGMGDPQPGQTPGLTKMADAFKKLGGEWLQSAQPTAVPVAPPEPPAPEPPKPAPTPEPPKPAVAPEPPKAKDPFDFAKPVEAPKPPVPPTQPVPDEIKSSAARERFRALETDRNTHMARADQAEAKLKALEAEYQKAKAKTVDSEALEMLRKENEELSKRINVLDVTQHPKFQAYFGGKEKQISEQISSAAGPDLAKTVLNILRGPDTQERANMLTEAIGQLPIWSQNKITAYAIQLDQLRAEQEQAIADAGKAREVLLQERESIQKAQKQEVDSTFNKVLAQAQDPKQGLEVLTPRDGDEAHNARVRAAVEQARSLVSGELDTEQMARAAMWGVAGPIYRQAVFEQAALIKKLEDQIAGMQAASPTLSGKVSQPAAPGTPSGFEAKFMHVFNGGAVGA